VGEILAQHQQMQEQMQQQQQQQISINMPSLDEEHAGDSQPASNTESIPMELDEMQGGDGQQIKFILNENGQLLQLDNNHIITTDEDGNQILVQGGDSDQIQQLLQSVVMQGNEVHNFCL
jgi:zinc finger protein 423